MMTRSILLGFAAALGAGLLIGIERERRKGTGPRRRFAGVRTFTLAALAGAGAHATGHVPLVFAGAALIVALSAVGYWRDRSADPGITTEVALFVTYLIGVVATDSPPLAAGGAVVVAALLVSRGTLHQFSAEILSETELRDGLLFCGAALVVLPLLPDHRIAWLPVVEPRRLWSLVVLFMGLQATGYVALRAAGPRLGLALSGLASGFVSSTATIAALGVRARRMPGQRNACVSGALFSTVATVVLLALIAAAVYPEGLRLLGPSLIAGIVAALGGAGLSFGLSLRTGRSAPAGEGARGRAFNILYAVGFAALVSAVTVVIGHFTAQFGRLALSVGAALAGLADVHAASASVLSVAAAGEVEPSAAVSGVLLAFTANTLSKLVAASGAGGMAYGMRVSAGLLLVVAGMWAPLLWHAA